MKIHKIPTMWLTVGFPGSGKSTWAKSTGLPVVETDDYRYVDGKYTFDKEREPWVFNQHDRKMRSFLGLGMSFILADTFLTRSLRLKYCIEALKHGYRVCVMWFLVPKELYTKQQTHGVDAEGFVRMEEVFEAPDVSKEPLARVYIKKRGF